MPPNGPNQPSCSCKPIKLCFQDIQNLVASARKNQVIDAPTQQITPDGQSRAKTQQHSRERDVRDVDPELDIVPTVDCTPPQQGTELAKYNGASCPQDDSQTGDVGRHLKLDTGRDSAQIERELQAQAAKASCPCDACVRGAIFEDCANPYIDIERKYLEAIKHGAEVSPDFIPDEPPPHDCSEHRDRPRDRGPGDPESDFEPKTCKNCSCCLAFRPHPPATLATPDLYRTCGLPKRFRYPAWFKGYGDAHQHPMYRTTYSDFGKYPPSVHTVPTVYHPIDRSSSNLYAKIGPYRDRSLRTSGSIWDAYTYYDFW